MMNKICKAIKTVKDSLDNINTTEYDRLVDACCTTIKNGRKTIIPGLGKNGPICQKVIDSMISIGINASFVHTGEALHGALGTISDGDLVILTSKSGNTPETIQMAKSIKANRNCAT